MDTAILIPVKRFAAAKQRLAAHFDRTARAMLAEALVEDFFAAVAPLSLRVFVASGEGSVLARARDRGWQTIAETEQVSESVSVDAASKLCESLGVPALLRLPADLPLAEPDDIVAVLEAAAAAPACVIVPSGDGTGTNALLRAPPTLFPSHFGPGSFAKHIAEAERAGAHLRVVKNERLGCDVDEIADLQAIAPHLHPGSATRRWCVAHDIL